MAAGHFHHATQGPGQGGFATTHRPHDGHQFPWGHRETHVQECRPGATWIGDGETAGFDGSLAEPPLARSVDPYRFEGRDNPGLALQDFLNPLQAHLAGLEGVEGETQQGRGEHQPFHEQDQRHDVANAQPARFELAAAEGQQDQQADR